MLAFKPSVKDFSKILTCKKCDNCKNVCVPFKTNLTVNTGRYYSRNRQMDSQEPLQGKNFHIGAPVTKRNVGNKNQYWKNKNLHPVNFSKSCEYFLNFKIVICKHLDILTIFINLQTKVTTETRTRIVSEYSENQVIIIVNLIKHRFSFFC